MRTLNNFILFMIGILTIASCQKDCELDYDQSTIDFSNQQMKNIYANLSPIGFESKNYSISAYKGDQEQNLVSISGKKLGLFGINSITYSNDALEPFIVNQRFISDVTIFYYNKIPFTEEDVSAAQSYPLIISSIDFEGNSFFFKLAPYDFWCKQSGFYMNGQIMLDYIMVEKTIPLSVSEMRIWKKNLILKTNTHIGDELFIIFNPQEKKIIYPNDMIEIKKIMTPN